MATLTIADLDNGKRDLQTVSEVANSRAATATTRFGQQTTTLYEAIRRINATGDDILSNLGFRVPVPYASGLNVTDSRFTVTGPDGKVYAPLSAPFTTGAWDPSQWYVLQNDLNDHKLLIIEPLSAAISAATIMPDDQVIESEGYLYTVESGVLTNKRLKSDSEFTAFTGKDSKTRDLQEKLSLELASAADWPGIDRTGATAISSAFSAFLTYACANGGKYQIPKGTYLLGATASAALSASVEFDVSPAAKFVSASGFPAGKMIQIGTGTGSNHTFKWRGGDFDGSNIPKSGPGEANDIFYFTASNCSNVDIELDRTFTGDNAGVSNGDSHLFIGEASRIVAIIHDAQGANDSAIYVSGSPSGVGESVFVDGSFRRCNNGAIVKRGFKVMDLNGRVVDCENGVGTGGVTDGSEPFGGDSLTINVKALRTTSAAFTQGTRGALVDVVSKDIGCTANGNTPTLASALNLSSGEGVSGTVIADGVNPALTLNNNFNAVRTSSRTIGAETRNSVGNSLRVLARNVGRSVVEGAGSDQNVYDIVEVNSAPPTLVGTASKVTRRANGAFSVFSGDDVSLGGRGSTETGAIAWFRSSALRTNVNRPQFSAGDAGEDVAFRAVGSDTNINLLLEAKGSGVPRYNPGQIKNFADDTAAAAGGIPIGGTYRTSNTLKIRMV